MRSLLITASVCLAMGSWSSSLADELGTNVPSDSTLLTTRAGEAGATGSGVFDIPAPPAGTVFQPAKRVPRDRFGVVGPLPLQLSDLHALVYPDATAAEREQLLEGIMFFTTQHTTEEGLGPLNNQTFCAGCHENTVEARKSAGLISVHSCLAGSTCISNVSRAARSSPTNFGYTSLDPVTGGGRAADNIDSIFNSGKTAAFTVFGDFDPNSADAASNPTGIGFFDPLDGSTHNIVTNATSQPFGGFVQRTRPAVSECVPDPIAPTEYDSNLTGSPDPATGLYPSGFRRSVGERAGPPYIGRGLMEAIPTGDIMSFSDPNDTQGHNSSLASYAQALGCTTDCIAGRPNMIPRTIVQNKDVNGNLTSVTGFVGGIGRFGLRSNGVEILQFIIGGLQGELSLTSLINGNEINFPTLFPTTGPTTEPAACAAARATSPETHLSTPFSERNFLRNTAPPEFGDALLAVLGERKEQASVSADTEAKVRRGAQLFGVDLKAFGNRMIAGRMPAGGDGRDPNAINQKDRMLNCVACHIPVSRTGQSPADVGAEHLSFVWAPTFTDLLIHKMPVINVERFSPMPRQVVAIPRSFAKRDFGDESLGLGNYFSENKVAQSYDLSRNLADDTFTNLKASADGREFRTAPLMGIGRIGPPFLHDARVYLSELTLDTNPAGTVTTNSEVTNAPLVVRTVNDALLAAIELHDLPAPDDASTPKVTGAGCPVPPAATNVDYGLTPQDVICPPYSSDASRTNRSDSREVIRRFRALSREDQEAVIAFLKQL